MENQYRSILKATSIFGGTQVLQILVGLLRSKLVAVLIGTTGMGLNSMYMSSLTMFITIFGLGINISVVRDLSKAYDKNDWTAYAKIIKVFRRLLLILGALGTLCVICMSPLLSQWTFKSNEYIIELCILSSIVFFTLQTQGNTALLVSSRQHKSIAASSLLGAIVSLLIAVPFFYFWRLDGIVPGLVFSTIGNYVITYLYARGVKTINVSTTMKEQKTLACAFVTLGVAMVIASLLGSATQYLINISITRLGGLSDLGLYGAGMTITFQAITMIFASMSSDYFPRLAAVMDNKERMNQTINEQSEIILLLAVPVLAVFMLFSPLLVRILLSDEFLPVSEFIRILCLGMFFKSASYALGYASFAKGDKKVYLFLEGGYSNALNLLLSVVFYYYWGLTGLAWSFVINYAQYYIIIKLVDRKRYGYVSTGNVNKIMLLSVCFLSSLLALSYLSNPDLYYIVGGGITVILSYVYLKNLNDKTALITTIVNKLRNKR